MSDFFSGRSDNGLAGGLPGGVKLAAIGLLVHMLMKHSRQDSGPAQVPAQGQGGGLGGLLGGLFGGGAGQGQAPGSWGGQPAQRSGSPWGQEQAGGLGGLLGAAAGGGLGGLFSGLGGLLGGLRNQGLGQHVDSWVGPGPNHAVSPQELERSFDPAELDEAARRAGTDRDTLLRELSGLLPHAVDRMTPQGRMPQREEELGAGGLGGLLSNIFGDPGHRQGPGNR